MATDHQPTSSPAEDRGPSADTPSAPLLSIGLPVHNGAEHLRESIDSLLAQDVGDLELIISDNASTDDTEAVCLEYASRDPRVRYGRNETNIGAAANYNRVFELSTGKYFMWGSDDDIWDPRFARMCIERLERSPDAVMCTSQVVFIDDSGAEVPGFKHVSVDTEGMDVPGRVFELTRQFGWFGIYSVIRPSALRASRLNLPTFGPDVRLQLELLLQGDALALPERLRRYRLPAVGKTAGEYVAEVGSGGHDASEDVQIRTPWTYLAREVLSVVRESVMDEAVVRSVENDLVETLTLVNRQWGDLVVVESGSPSTTTESTVVRRVTIAAALGVEQPKSTGVVFDPRAWLIRDGARLHWLRRIALRLLKPFGDRQNELNRQQADAIARLSHDVAWLERRIRALERGQSRCSEEPRQPL